jgi:hypothetical protein
VVWIALDDASLKRFIAGRKTVSGGFAVTGLVSASRWLAD